MGMWSKQTNVGKLLTVSFISYSDAASNSMAYIDDNGTSWFGPNSDSIQSNRESVRLQSKDTYNNVLIIAQFDSVPGSYNFYHLHLTNIRCSVCGSWPAFWTANLNNWPNGGEIDILEGVNNQQYNHYGFHVGGTCSQSGANQTGYAEITDCNVYDNGNAGCGGWAASSNTYGDGMNDVNGGVYAMDWREEGIRIWYFEPDAVPEDICNGNPTTSGWGTVIFLSHEFLTDVL